MELSTSSAYYAVSKHVGLPLPPSPSPPPSQSSNSNNDSNNDSNNGLSSDSSDRVHKALDAFLSTYYLSKFSKQIALTYVSKIAADSTPDQDRVKKWLMRQMNKTLSPPPNCSPWQRGCPEKLPLLTALPVWPTSEFSWVPRLESSFPVILSELLSLRSSTSSGFQPYRAPSTGDLDVGDSCGVSATDKGSWNVFYLSLGSVMDFSSNRSLCPKTCEILESIPGIYGHSFFSCLAPNSHITKHNGPTNKKLRCFFPLICQDNARLRVGSVENVPLKKGKVLIWDDSFEHESWNDDDSSRITLIFDVWHPETTVKERKFLSFLGNSQLRAQKKIVEMSGNKDNFFSIIDRAQYLEVAKEELWT
ncbi:hypothetical protein TrVE_jg2339 [Triparma verrucosa]|uniref:Aspartyl/asparaginy/proline hydroxylase domain-containing protein n=2 Tax=Triparma TaxID=722752 RepID=A0A9W7E6D2_9STRA|nr:hypothetical protein TrST_g14139 [Triparma strigata]GMI10687.1 hypothetical protein TrVE_jg2339 [Triparma verrucosa]